MLWEERGRVRPMELVQAPRTKTNTSHNLSCSSPSKSKQPERFYRKNSLNLHNNSSETFLEYLKKEKTYTLTGNSVYLEK